MLVALVSAFSRAGLNLVDRYQIGLQRLSIVTVNFWNNTIPAGAMVALTAGFGWHRELGACLIDARTALFSALVQLVAYSFSYAFRHLNVSQVTVAGKASDLFIPIGIFVVAGHWDWVTYGFAVTTTLVCLPLLHSGNSRRHPEAMKAAFALIGGALVLQASLAPLLVGPGQVTSSVQDTLIFATAVIVWRVAWSLLPMLRRGGKQPVFSWALLVTPVFMVRVLLSIATQITFVVAISSSASAVAWPILNSTGILAMLLSSLLLKEKPSGPEKWIVTAITVLGLLRFFSL